MNNFRDIAETLVIVYQVLSGRIKHPAEVTDNEEYIKLCNEIHEYIKELSIHNALTYSDIILTNTEAFYGLMAALSRVIPIKKSTGYNIITYLRNNIPSFEWTDRRELEFQLLKNIYKCRNEDITLKALLILDYPENIHRLILDIYIFTRIIVIILQIDHNLIMPHILSLVNLFSLGSLTTLQVFHIKDDIVELKVVHSTKMNESKLNRIISNINDIVNQNKECISSRIFLQILENAMPFCLSIDKDRLAGFLDYFINLTESIFLTMSVVDCKCDLCKGAYNVAILPYQNKEFIINGFKNYKHQFIELAKSYDDWIRKGEILSWVRYNHKRDFQGLLKDRKIMPRYDYL